ncbi:MAG: hypothetical protein CL685_04225 [Candidatus Magasanikbacteria bacterium]|nr:hypothetical protein [Candidatus Magasanikbacteria bacterium]|tara:strand:+ start:4059 stop:4649 length:591 start_codon:yes stop_codon:yes gene_type:complete
MIDKTYITKMRRGYQQHASIRRDVIVHSGDVLHAAKRAIFSLHRHETKEAEKKMALAKKIIVQLQKKYKKHPTFSDEGSYKAAIEEYVEARLLHQYITKGKIQKITDVAISADSYLAGLCDVPGELYRYAIGAAAKKDHAQVDLCKKMANEIIGELIEFDFTKYLRTKFDQAKKAVHKIEIVHYELSLRLQDCDDA